MGRAVDIVERWKRDHKLKVEHLVRANDDFIVFIDEDGDLDWVTADEYDRRTGRDEAQANAAINEASTLEASPCEGFRKESVLQAKRLIGEAIVCALAADYENARNQIAAAKKFLEARNQEISRY